MAARVAAAAAFPAVTCASRRCKRVARMGPGEFTDRSNTCIRAHSRGAQENEGWRGQGQRMTHNLMSSQTETHLSIELAKEAHERLEFKK